jgi:hypothetical protein
LFWRPAGCEPAGFLFEVVTHVFSVRFYSEATRDQYFLHMLREALTIFSRISSSSSSAPVASAPPVTGYNQYPNSLWRPSLQAPLESLVGISHKD